MAREGKGSKVVAFSLPKDEGDNLEEYVTDTGYGNRSELIRDALRSFIRRKKDLLSIGGNVEGVVVLLYNHSADKLVSDVRHENMGSLINSYTHADMVRSGSKCCEVLFISGPAKDVTTMVDGLQAIKGVEEAEVFLA